MADQSERRESGPDTGRDRLPVSDRLPATDQLRVSELRRGQQRALVIALVANAVFLVVEVTGGIVFRSLALLADAAHMLTDVAALSIALAAHRLLERPATRVHTYGFHRAEVLGAQANGIILLGVSVWITVEAVRRMGAAVEVVGTGVLAVASVGLLVNLGSAGLLARVRGGSLNLRGALFHLVLDAVGSIGAILTGLAVIFFGAHWVDPVVSLLIVVLVVASAWVLLRETTRVLLEGAPRGLDVREVEAALRGHPAVEEVHHVHAWTLGSDVVALSAHVVVEEDLLLHDAQILGDELKEVLGRRFGIDHATLELECHVCAPEPPAQLD